MRVCLDTNALVQLFGRNALARPIRNALLAGQIEWVVSNEILLEYEEVVTLLSGPLRRPCTWQEWTAPSMVWRHPCAGPCAGSLPLR